MIDFLTAWRDKTLPTPITIEVLERTGVSTSLAPRTLQSLVDLDLLDANGTPTAELEGLKRLPQTEFVKGLAALVRSVYAEVFQFVDPATDDASRVAEQFRVFEPLGQRPRMVMLFLGLCEAAGIVPEGTRRASPSTRSAAKRRPKAKRSNDGAVAGDHATAAKRRSRASATRGGLPEPLMGLIRAIPLEGWSQDRRDKFLETFGAVLDFTVPIESGDSNGNGEEESDGQ